MGQPLIRSNPRDPSIFFRFSGMALAHYLAGRFDTAAEWATKSAHIMPQWYLAHFVLAASLVKAGRHEDAKSAIQNCRAALPDASTSYLQRMPLKDTEVMDQLRAALLQAGLPD